MSLKFVSTFVPSNLQPQVEGGSAEQKGGGGKQEDQRAANKGWEIEDQFACHLVKHPFFSLFLKKEERMLNKMKGKKLKIEKGNYKRGGK